MFHLAHQQMDKHGNDDGSTLPSSPPIVYFFVEGSIGAGKTTILECLERRVAATGGGASIVTVPEPIAAWRNVRGHNVLNRFYAEPARWALARLGGGTVG